MANKKTNKKKQADSKNVDELVDNIEIKKTEDLTDDKGKIDKSKQNDLGNVIGSWFGLGSKESRIMPREAVDPKYKKEMQKQLKKKHKNLDISQAERYKVDAKEGLNAEQVDKRIKDGFANRIENKNVKTYKSIFFSNIFTFFNLLCFTVAAALIWAGAWNQLVFVFVIMANMVIGIFQEIRAKRTIEKISLVSAPVATVIREGYKREIPINEVVLDDVLYYETGKQICADCVVLSGEIEANESLLTGESIAVKKKKGDILYSGSFVASGNCYALAERVGQFSYTAKLSSQAKQYKKPKSELLSSLNMIIKSIGFIILPLATLMYFNNFANVNGVLSNPVSEAIQLTAGSIIGMIPSGMFLLTSLALAVGVIKLASKRTLVQDLYSIEMLARADVLCLDKTGTITDGSMKVNEVVLLDTKTKHPVKDIMGSMLTALEDNNQTSRALSTHFGYSKELLKKTVLPFSSSRKLSAVTFTSDETFVYGAPEFVLKTKDQEVDNLVKQYASKGFRVILLAKCDGVLSGENVPTKRTPVAIIVIEDHIRPEAEETLKWFAENNVKVKIISGDNPITVSEVSKRVGVIDADKFISLEGLTERQIIDAATKYTVFGRVLPEQKRILVKALKNKGHKVAMTGDGVNDILALKEADCSIAMASGSEAARNVSHLVLLDSNFASMPSVVAEGRRVINNIQKSSSLFLMKTFFTIFLTIFFIVIGEGYPFKTTHIYLLEMAVIGIAAFFLSMQPNKDKIEGRFLPNLIIKSLPGAIVFTINVIACYMFDQIIGTNGEFVTMGSLLITFAGLMVLFKLCKPFDVYRGILFTGILIFIVLVLALVPWSFFEYTTLSLQNILFILVLGQASYPMYAYVVNWCSKINIDKG